MQLKHWIILYKLHTTVKVFEEHSEVAGSIPISRRQLFGSKNKAAVLLGVFRDSLSCYLLQTYNNLQ